MRSGEEVRGEVYSSEEKNKENAAKEEHFGTTEMPASEAHGDEENNRRG